MWKLEIVHCTECQLHLLTQTPSTGLQHQHPSFNHCHMLVTPQGPENCQLTSIFFLGAQTVVSLLQTTQIISDVCFTTDRVAYASSNKTKIIWNETELFFFFHPGWMHPLAWVLGCFCSQIRTQTFRRVLTTSVDSCTEIKSAPSVA